MPTVSWVYLPKPFKPRGLSCVYLPKPFKPRGYDGMVSVVRDTDFTITTTPLGFEFRSKRGPAGYRWGVTHGGFFYEAT